MTRFRDTYVALRRQVDHDLARQFGPRWSLLAGFAPAFALMLVDAWRTGASLAGKSVVAIWGAAWLTFLCWRGFRLVRAASIRGDRAFDQQDRAYLPLEYADSESVLAARRRKRRAAR